MEQIIYVQAIFHRADKYKKLIKRDLNEKGWTEYKFSGQSNVWRSNSRLLKCYDIREMELRAERDFFTCAVVYKVKVTLMYQVNMKKAG